MKFDHRRTDSWTDERSLSSVLVDLANWEANLRLRGGRMMRLLIQPNEAGLIRVEVDYLVETETLT